MTHPPRNANTPEPARDNSVSGRASYPNCIAPVGSNAIGFPAPEMAGGSDRHQGVPVRGDATEGGSHPQGKEQHTCHSPHCTHAAPAKPRSRQRLHDANKRKHQPSCRMNDEEFQQLVRAAAVCQMSVASFLAHAALRAARDLNRTAAEIASEREVIDELFAVRRHLSQIGNNLNQVAKATNSGADVPHATAVLNAVRAAAQRVDTFTQHCLDTETRAG
ncbi:plasmid mobilization protein [Streptomyces sp. NPDC088846]|uniref:plasmid mobilization protein n=1 Tax=Streptomyces sp. NPDC088846 TaxID=3365908 RepID=UPI003801FD2C